MDTYKCEPAGPVSDEAEDFKDWEPLDFEYWHAMRRIDMNKKIRDLDELDVEEELGLSKHN